MFSISVREGEGGGTDQVTDTNKTKPTNKSV